MGGAHRDTSVCDQRDNAGPREGDWEPGLVAVKGTAEPIPCANSAMRKSLGTTRR